MVYRSSRAPRRTTGSSEDEGGRPHNVFRNDGSFLEMFKKMQERGAASGPSGAGGATTPASDGGSPTPEVGAASSPKETTAPVSPGPSVQAPLKAPFVGKRRGGRVLPTGKVKRLKPESDSSSEVPKDAWSAYLAEVKRYKETTCEEDGKTRPLVK